MGEGRGLHYRIGVEPGRLAEAAEAAAAEAVRAAGQVILERSRGLAPRRSGALAASGRLETEGGRARITYGAAYAAIQHDGAGFAHPGGGQAEYLAAALREPGAAKALREGFAGALGAALPR